MAQGELGGRHQELGREHSPDAADLRRFSPRTALRWLRDDPARRHRAFDASLVFVDISGFTAMSERLARHGRVGAEEVTDLLNRIFSDLLAVAYADGGSLLKFGGDALLIQFDGVDHPLHAVHAAWGMRQRLRELQPLQSSAGQVRLRMSVGVHTGTVHHLLVGSRHRELLLVGPAVTETVRMESAASAGQILLSADLVNRLAGEVTTEALGPGYLLRRAPPPAGASPPPDIDAEGIAVDLGIQLLSGPVRERLAGGIPESEHRPAAVGFVKFVGTDDLLIAGGVEAVVSAAAELVDAVEEAAAPDDVCVLASDVDADGGKLVLTAGVPTNQEFDGERLLRTLRRIVDADVRLQHKIGAHYGPVFAGVIGPPFRLTYSIIGDTVNLAARVMSRAEPGEVLATPAVLNRSRALFRVSEVPPFVAKGKRDPVVAFRVGAVASERVRRARARFPLAGRASELGALLDAADAAAAGSGRVVQVIGPAGIGKSRLLDELHERRPDVAVVMASCNQHDRNTAYHSVGAIVRQVLRLGPSSAASELEAAVDRAAPALTRALPLLGDVVGVAVPENDVTRHLTPTFRFERTAEAVADLLGGVLDKPAVIVVEDLHWIDPESWSLVQVLTSALADRPWLLVLTSRTSMDLGDADAPHLRIEVAPLPADEARGIVLAAVEEGLVSVERGVALLDRSGGNPFFLQELLTTTGTEVLPDSVDALIQTQLDRLPADERDLLAEAAVLGAEVDVDLLHRTTGLERAALQLAFDRLADFLEPVGDETYRFRHALVHDGAYARLPFRRRRERHRAAVTALESRPAARRRPDLLAVHTYLARDWVPARTYSLEAAAAAADRFANLTAAGHYRHALECGRHVPGLTDEDVAATWERLGDTLLRASSYDDAVHAYRQAKRLSAPNRKVRLCGQIGQVRERQGRYVEALRWFGRGLRLDSSPDGVETGRLLVESGIVRIRQGDLRSAVRLAAKAAGRSDHVQIQARVAYIRAWAAALRGEDAPDEQRRMLALWRSVDDVIGLGLAYNVISISAYFRGDWDEAADAYERAAELRDRVGDEVAAATARGNLGELLGDQGHFARAEDLLEHCRAVCGAAGFQSSRVFATAILGRLAARQGRYEEAASLLEQARTGAQAIGMPAFVFDAQRYLAELAVFRGELEPALALAEDLDAAASSGSVSLRLVGDRLRTCVFLQRGAVEDAHRVASQLHARLDPGARDYDTALSLVAVGAAFAAAGDERAIGVDERARQLLVRLGVVVPGELLVFGPGSALASGAVPAASGGGHQERISVAGRRSRRTATSRRRG